MKNSFKKIQSQNKYNKNNIIYPPQDNSQKKNNIQTNPKRNYSLNDQNNNKNSQNQSKKGLNKNNEKNQNTYYDPRLKLTFTYLDIESILPIFINNNITFNDLLLLSRSDLIELGLSMIERNRILHFSQQFIKYGKAYTINEISSFFEENKNVYCNTISNTSNNINNNINIYSNYSNNFSQKNAIESNPAQNNILSYSNGFESKNNYNIFNSNDKEKEKDKDKDSQQELDFCNIIPGHISQSKTNTSSKNNNNSPSSGQDFFLKYQELTQEVDNYLNKFNEYKQSWYDSKKKYDNLMNSYLIKSKPAVVKKNNKQQKNKSQINMNKNNPEMNKDSYERLKSLKERKEELKKQIEKINDKSNHKKMIIKYLEENE